MPDMSDWNRQTIEEFRANKGKVGGFWEGKPLLLITTTGAKSSQHRTTPTMYMRDGDRMLIFASKGGAPTHPAWYHNLVAHPQVTVEVGTETYEATATVLQGAERDRFYDRQAQLYPQFGEYQTRTNRKIPVIALERIRG
jgi:deazaflavin-dependent oxidoreductase (nitroreductase family)